MSYTPKYYDGDDALGVFEFWWEMVQSPGWAGTLMRIITAFMVLTGGGYLILEGKERIHEWFESFKLPTEEEQAQADKEITRMIGEI